MPTQYFEDLEPGETREIGPRTVTENEIVEFAEQYDPQSFHVDREAAEASVFCGLIASGWHTAAVAMELLVNGLFKNVAMVGALGVNNLRWQMPVYAGDEIWISTTIVEKEVWDEEKGLVRFKLEAFNQHDEMVLTRTDLVLIERVS